MPEDINLTQEGRQALEWITEAGLLARRIQDTLVEPALEKADRSPVTVADFAVQALIAARLGEGFPDDPLLAEETADELASTAGRRQLAAVGRFLEPRLGAQSDDQIAAWVGRGGAQPSGRCWILDPIDGTRGFLRDAHYAVALALMEDGEIRLGALACPRLDPENPGPAVAGHGCVVLAERGRGCWMAPLEDPGRLSPLSVSECAEPSEARILRSVEKAHTNLSQTDEVMASLGSKAPSVGMDSQAKYALLAAGGGDLLLRLISTRSPDYREKIWDHAAGSIVVEEAGGHVSDLAGRPLDFSAGRTLDGNRGVVASNGRLHDAVLTALGQVGVRGSKMESE